MMRSVMVLLVILLLMAGCASPDGISSDEGRTPAADSPIETGRTPSAPTASIPTEPIPTTPVFTAIPPILNDQPSLETPLADPVVEALVQQARAMLADKLGLEPQAIALFELQAMEWRDESLGCPLGAGNYAQVITPGYLIELEAGDSIYVFHSDRASRVVLCGLEPTRTIYQPP